MLSAGSVEEGDSLVRGSIKATVIIHLCAMIQPSFQIHFFLKQRHKQCCINILNRASLCKIYTV